MSPLQQLAEKIQKLSEAEHGKGRTGLVVYAVSSIKRWEVELPVYGTLPLYCMQSGERSTQVSFDASNKTIITYSSKVTEPSEDRTSFEKYGGNIYRYEPLTDEVCNIVLATIK